MKRPGTPKLEVAFLYIFFYYVQNICVEIKKKNDYPLLPFEQCGLKNVSVAENQHCAGGGAGARNWEGENSFMSPYKDYKDYKVPVSQNMFYCYLFYSFIGKYWVLQ